MSQALNILKERLDYAVILRLLGIPFVDAPGEGCYYFRCLNPDHEDRDPSMKVQYRTRGKARAGLWRCWNKACGEWGKDIFDLVRIIRRTPAGKPCSLRAAVQFAEGTAEAVKGHEVFNALALEDLDAQFVPDTISYADRPFPVLIPQPHRPVDPMHYYFTMRRAPPVNPLHAMHENAVVMTEGEYRGYMVVPICWHDGSVITFQAIALEDRALDWRREYVEGTRKSVAAKLFPPRAPVDQLLYGAHRLKPASVVVVVEGIYDLWRVWDAFTKYPRDFDGWTAVATFTNRLTHDSTKGNDQAAILRQHFPKEIVVLPDNDPKKEGEEAAGAQLVLDVGKVFSYACPVSIGRLPPGHDPDSAGATGVANALRSRVSYARWAIERAAGPRVRPGYDLSD